MAIANARGWRPVYLKETTPGITPGAAGTVIRSTGGGGRIQFTSEDSAETTLFETPDFMRTDADGTITLNGEWSYGVLHWLLEGIHGNTFSTNVLTVGSTLQTFTYEDQWLNIATPKYLPFKGCVVERLTINYARGKVTWSATLRPMTLPTAYASATVFTGGPTAAPTNRIISHVTGLQLAQEGGALDLKGTVGISQFSLEFVRPAILYKQVGSLSSADIDQGAFRASGTVSCWFKDTTILDKVLGDTLSSLAFTIGDPSAKKEAYLFTSTSFLDGGTEPVTLNNGVLQTFQFGSRADATNTSSKITRTP